jgi:hypothetical protein
VDVKSIVVSMLDRLANFAAQEPTNFPREIDVFKIFSSAITNIIEVLIATYELPPTMNGLAHSASDALST